MVRVKGKGRCINETLCTYTPYQLLLTHCRVMYAFYGCESIIMYLTFTMESSIIM